MSKNANNDVSKDSPIHSDSINTYWNNWTAGTLNLFHFQYDWILTGQHDPQDESLTGQIHNQSGHCPLTGCYFEPWNNELSSSLRNQIVERDDTRWQCRYSYHQRENTDSRLFTEVKALLDVDDIWMGDHLDKIPCAALLGKSGWPSTSTANVVCGLSFSRSQPDFGGFLRALWFPPSSKLTSSITGGHVLENSILTGLLMHYPLK